MTSSGCSPEGVGGDDRGVLLPRRTADGSPTLFSCRHGETFHSDCGALGEAEWKFVRPAGLEQFAPGQPLRVLDVCLGLGYNSAALMERCRRRRLRLTWLGLEWDRRPLGLALAEGAFRRLWSAAVLGRLEAIHARGRWQDDGGHGRVLWQDARRSVADLAAGCDPAAGFDLVLLDPFSPRRCPQLWTREFLGQLARLLAPAGRLLTYSRSASVRCSLREAGLELLSLTPAPGQRRDWSGGTMAVKDSPPASDPGWHPLTPMEEEHLRTRAAVPYRDPLGRAGARELLERRRLEQAASGLESTSSWQRRWRAADPR
jgi:hypothetical protein